MSVHTDFCASDRTTSSATHIDWILYHPLGNYWSCIWACLKIEKIERKKVLMTHIYYYYLLLTPSYEKCNSNFFRLISCCMKRLSYPHLLSHAVHFDIQVKSEYLIRQVLKIQYLVLHFVRGFFFSNVGLHFSWNGESPPVLGAWLNSILISRYEGSTLISVRLKNSNEVVFRCETFGRKVL